jgi:hypothetical protein
MAKPGTLNGALLLSLVSDWAQGPMCLPSNSPCSFHQCIAGGLKTSHIEACDSAQVLTFQ